MSELEKATEFGDRLVEEMQRTGTSFADITSAIDRDSKYLEDAMHGEFAPSVATLRRIADRMGLSKHRRLRLYDSAAATQEAESL